MRIVNLGEGIEVIMKILFPQNLIGRSVLSLWLAACVSVLVFAFIQRNIHDTDIAFTYLMIFLTFPIGYGLAALLGLIFWGLYNLFGVFSPGGFLPNTFTWIIFVVAGYFQWFVLIPWLYQKLRKSTNQVAKPD